MLNRMAPATLVNRTKTVFLKCYLSRSVVLQKKALVSLYDFINSNLPKVDKIVTSATRAYINRSPECIGKFEHHGTVDIALTHGFKCGERQIAGDFSHSIYRSQRHSSLFPG